MKLESHDTTALEKLQRKSDSPQSLEYTLTWLLRCLLCTWIDTFLLETLHISKMKEGEELAAGSNHWH